MTYPQYFILHNRLIKMMQDYAVKYNAVGNYLIAQSLMIAVNEKAFKDEKLRKAWGRWISHGSTIRLKILLNQLTEYDDFAHYNAFTLMDSARENVKETKEE